MSRKKPDTPATFLASEKSSSHSVRLLVPEWKVLILCSTWQCCTHVLSEFDVSKVMLTNGLLGGLPRVCYLYRCLCSIM